MRLERWVVTSVCLLLVACPSSDDSSATGDAQPDSTVSGDGGPSICDVDQFIEAGGNGGLCPTPSQVLCFPQCMTGGCICVPGPAGQPVWQCTNDTSCLPECGPLADCGADLSDSGVEAAADGGTLDGGISEGGADAKSDAAGEVAADSGGEAAVEASADAASE